MGREGRRRAGTPDQPSSPSYPGPGFGEPPPAYPIPTRPPWAHDPPDEGGGERPQGPQAHLLWGSCRHHPPGPGLPGSNRLSIQLPVARSPGRARPTSPGRSPGLDFATYPTPEGEPREWAGGAGGGNQAQVGGRRRRDDHLQRAGAGERGCGLAAPANQSPGVSPLPHPPHPLPSQVAHSSSGRCPLAFQSPRHSRNRKKKQDTEETTPKTRGDGAGAPEGAERGGPQGPARHLPSAHPESQPRPLPAASPVTALPRPPLPGPFPGRRRQGRELPLPSPTPASGAPRPPPPPNRPKAPRTF